MLKNTLTRLTPISHKKVKINDSFWSEKLEINTNQTIPFEYEKIKRRIDAFKLDWSPSKQVPHIFWDSDVAKWIEAVGYTLVHNPNPELEELVDQVIELIESAQQEDGYLNIYYTSVKPDERWTDLEGGHELYCAGHMIEGAVAYFEATGKRKLLDVVCRYADYIDSVFGNEPGKKRGYPGHEEIELALVKLYRVTNEERYLKLSQYFIDERGKKPYYFDEERSKRNNEGFLSPVINQLDDLSLSEYHQSHKPVREQDEVVGHAVRAMYLYSGMTDLAYETGDESLYLACDRLWNHLVNKRMYITGGIGSAERNEGFTYDYDLPNLTSYAETCAAIGLVFWNHRMVQLDCDGRYTDLLERTLYNAVLAGVSLDGNRFFYSNPLESNGKFHRSEWFDVACCPPNLARLLASLGNYIYSQTEEDIVVHLYVQSEAEAQLSGDTVKLKQQTNYPWDSNIKFQVNTNAPKEFGIKLRIPNWSPDFKILVNGQEMSDCENNKGYVTIKQTWNDGDWIELSLSMPVQHIYAHPNVQDCFGKVALQKGPFIYCIEEIDNQVPTSTIFLPEDSDFTTDYHEDLLNGISVIETEGLIMANDDENLYSNKQPKTAPIKVKAIPYFAWDNRESGSMNVWIKEIKGYKN